MDKISKHKNELQLANTAPENVIFANVSQIIEKRKFNVISAANNQIALMFWEIGKYINSAVLGMERAKYGKRIVATVSQQLTEKYGRNFEKTNLTRMSCFHASQKVFVL